MSDLISRQAAIDALGNAHFKNYGNAIMVIQVLPSAEPDTERWISVKERVPDNEQTEYLITVFDKEDGVSEVYKGFYQDGEWWTQLCHDCKRISEEPCGDNVVTAWMELPKAYEPKWIDVVNENCICPICGSEWSYFENETERFKYCPNCGADMRGNETS